MKQNKHGVNVAHYKQEGLNAVLHSLASNEFLLLDDCSGGDISTGEDFEFNFDEEDLLQKLTPKRNAITIEFIEVEVDVGRIKPVVSIECKDEKLLSEMVRKAQAALRYME